MPKSKEDIIQNRITKFKERRGSVKTEDASVEDLTEMAEIIVSVARVRGRSQQQIDDQSLTIEDVSELFDMNLAPQDHAILLLTILSKKEQSHETDSSVVIELSKQDLIDLQQAGKISENELAQFEQLRLLTLLKELDKEANQHA